jgi:hypothetical protein
MGGTGMGWAVSFLPFLNGEVVVKSTRLFAEMKEDVREGEAEGERLSRDRGKGGC